MKKGTITFAMGILTGLALCGPAAQAADYLKATLSTQPIYVDGVRVPMTAYAINGNNYVKLRDIGKAVGFGVTYDAATNSVYIDSDAPYQAEAAKPAQITTAPGTVTEESAKAALEALKERYPLGSTYSAPYHSTSGGPYGTSISNCAGWAILCSDAVFGDSPWRKISSPSWEDIRAGDLIQYDNDMGGHAIIVTDKTDETLSYTDSGPSLKVYWGSQVPRWWLEQRPGLVVYTRYPN